MAERGNFTLTRVELILPFTESANGVRVAQYLLSDELYSDSALPRHIDFGLYTSIMSSLYAEYKTVYRFDERQRQTALGILEAEKRKHPLLLNLPRKVIAEIDYEFLAFSNQTAGGERHAVVYRDPLTKTAGVSTTTFGEYSSVSNREVNRLVTEGKRPFLNFHTHPKDEPFSTHDYIQMIAPLEGGKPRFKGQVVLCPTLQLMALITSQTPCMPINAAIALAESWSRIASGEEGEGTRLVQAVNAIENDNTEWHNRGIPTLLKIKHASEQRRDRRKIRREVERSQRKYEVNAEKYIAALRKAHIDLKRFTDGKLIEFVRHLDIALYMSTNSKDFYKFSA